MARFDGTQYDPPADVPPFFREFMRSYQTVLRFLLEFNSNRLRFGTDIRNQAVTVDLPHGRPTTFNHNLNFSPLKVDIVGRVQMYTVDAVLADSVTVTAKLLTTEIINPAEDRMQRQIVVSDPVMFRRGDVVLLGGNRKTITEIQGQLVTLDSPVLLGKAKVMSLANDTVRIVVY